MNTSALPARDRNLWIGSWVLTGAALVGLVGTGMMVYQGHVVQAGHKDYLPYVCLLGSTLAFAIGQGVRARPLRAATLMRSVAGRMTLMALALALSFGAGEIALRRLLSTRAEANSFERFKRLGAKARRGAIQSTHPLSAIIQPSAHERLVYELQPNLDMEFGDRRLRTNQDGMRESRDYPRERLPRSVRIIGVGDSGMFGWGVEQDADYMAVLETILNRRHGGLVYEVLNLGVPGYNSSLEVECLRQKGLPYRPDIVIVGWCENDGHLPFFLIEKVDFRRTDLSFLHLLLFNRPRFWSMASGQRIADQRDFKKESVSADILEGTEEAGLRAAFKEFLRLSEEHGFHLLMFGPMGKGVCHLADEVGLTYYNTYKKVDKSLYPPDWNVHFMHPSAEGHAVLAEHLEKELDRLGWLHPAAVAGGK